MRIQCKTLFDCTPTGVTGTFRATMLPFVDRAGQPIDTQAQWNRSRNQQRNWETVLQIAGLRAQPMDIALPQRVDNTWQFEFTVEAEAVYATEHDPLGCLLADCEGVPMITGLGECTGVEPRLTAQGEPTIWFSMVNSTAE